MLSNLPPRGSYDWLPDEYSKRKYIFEIWRSVCSIFGYQEYLTPLLENADLYRKKSGGELGTTELIIIPKDDFELAIRPEMTPSVSRMVSRIYDSAPKPLRLFSIANFYRYQKPQKGRNREFWQLNCDIFGSSDTLADFEILQIAIEIMKSFGANSDQFTLLVNNRNFINFYITQILEVPQSKIHDILGLFDRFFKITNREFLDQLRKNFNVAIENEGDFLRFLNGEEIICRKYLDEYTLKTGDDSIKSTIDLLNSTGYSDFVNFSPCIVRGLEYYDGMVFEMFDKKFLDGESSEDGINRSLFGGGRYNGLSDIFGKPNLPAVGFAPGDETTKLFLESYRLMPEFVSNKIYYLPILSADLSVPVLRLANQLRSKGLNIVTSVAIQNLSKSLDIANRNKYRYVVIAGENELNRETYILKDLVNKTQEEFSTKTT